MISLNLHSRSAPEECTRALTRWQDAHAHLLPAIADYLNACACLQRALSQSTFESCESKLASALSCVDDSLPSLDQGAFQLQSAQKTLRYLRNRSRTLAPINTLPVELLTRIFALAKSCALHSSASHSNPGRFSVGSISSVCSYWRKIALGANSLWNHIDLSVGKVQNANLELYASESLNRAGNLPLYIHMAGDSRYQATHQRPAQLLAPFANRILSLDLQINILTAQAILRGIFRPGCGSSVQELYIYDEDGDDYEIAEGGFNFLGGDQVFSDLLSSLTTFHLRGLLFNASSPVFKGLTELVLKPYPDGTEWSYSELHSVLSSSPKLRSLTLIRLHLRVDNYHLQVVDLGELEVLDLRGNEFKHVLPILSWIDCGSNALSLSLSVGNDQPMNELFQLRNFIERSHVTRFCLHMDYGRVLDLGILSSFLKDLLPLVEELAFQENTFTHHTEGPLPLRAEYFPRLHALHLVECSLTPNALRHLLLSSSIQKVKVMSTDLDHLAGVEILWKDSKFAWVVSFVQCTPVAEGRPLLEWPLDTYP
ncbi:hypothetical protein BDV93DRAFT_541171 [Ceratobasidium sp. AG-I]|nr:hypothetical protein BDV93DRAFT_541171 [Ceratobasidium sp. AG-I]